MDPSSAPIDPEDVARSTERLRAIARSLVRDGAAAEDVAQQAWLAALEGGCPADVPLRWWLAGVVRHLAHRFLRTESRRRRREHAAARSETVSGDAAAAASRAEAQRRIASAVLALEEPYRSVVLLRFFEGLTPGEIAERLGQRPGTVRMRLKRGLDLLRVRLDGEHAGERRQWALAMLPLLAVRRSGGAATVALGGLLMKTATKAALAAVLVLVLTGAAALWPTTPPRRDDPAVADKETSPRAPAARPRTGAPSSVPSSDELAGAAANPATSPRVTLRGSVADEGTRAPIAGARVAVLTKTEDGTGSSVAAVTDASGRFELAVPPGRILVRAECDGWYQPYFPSDASELDIWRHGAQCFDRNAVDVPAEGAVTIDVLLARTGGVEGQVLFVDGSPVPDAGVVVRSTTAGARSTQGVADPDGRFRIAGVPPGAKLWFEATKPGLVTAAPPVVAAVDAGRVTAGIVVRMRRPPIVTGRLTSAAGKALVGACVQVVVVTDNRSLQWGPNGEWLVWSDAPRTPAHTDGTYEIPVWPVHGEFVVRAVGPGHRPAQSPPVRYFDERDVYRVDLTLAEGAALGGRVTAKATGAGIPGALVFAGPATNPLAKVVAPLRAVCDAEGRFAFDSLPTETYLVSASAEGYVECRIPPVTTPAQDVALVLAPALSIAGTVRLGGRPLAGALVGVQAQDDDALELFDCYVKPFADTATSTDDGSFRVRGLAAGTYCLHVRPSGKVAFRATFSVPIAAGSEGVVVDVEALAAGEAPDPYAAMSNNALGCVAYGLSLSEKDYEGAIARWRSLLARPLTRNERAAALIEYASPLGNLGRRDEQDAALRQALDLAGASTARGLTAISRLAWSRYWAGDPRAALEMIRPVTVSADVVQAAGARWSAARFSAKLGDVAGARASLTTLRAELNESTDSRLKRLLPQIEKSLADLADR